jgi:hypothetical protein
MKSYDNPRDPNIWNNPYWDKQREQAHAATQGINQMPGVFSNYGAIPGMDPSQVKQMMFPGTKQIGIGGGQVSPLQQMVGGGQDAAGLLGGPAPNSLLAMGLAGLMAQPHLISSAVTGNVNPLTGKPLTPEESALVTQAASQLTQGG